MYVQLLFRKSKYRAVNSGEVRIILKPDRYARYDHQKLHANNSEVIFERTVLNGALKTIDTTIEIFPHKQRGGGPQQNGKSHFFDN